MSNPKFRVGPAIWKSHDSDLPVEVISYLAGDDGIEYVYTEGGTYIPLDDIYYETEAPLLKSEAKIPETESEIVGLTEFSSAIKKTSQKLTGKITRIAENLGETVEGNIPSLIKDLLPENSKSLVIGSVVGSIALLGGGYAVDRLSKSSHEGRTKKGMWRSNEAGVLPGLAAGLYVFNASKSPFKAGAALGLTAFAANSLYDYKYQHGSLHSNIVKNSLVGATSFLVYAGARTKINQISSFATHLARDTTLESSLSSTLKNFPILKKILNAETLPMALGALSVPIAHSIISRALASGRHSIDKGAAMAGSLLPQEAGNRGGRVFSGPVHSPTLPLTSVNAHGSIKTYYDESSVQRNIL